MKLRKRDPNEGLNEWHSKFAFIPVDLNSGERVWWEWYEEAEIVKYHSYGNQYITKMVTRARESNWVPDWAVHFIEPDMKIRRLERFDF